MSGDLGLESFGYGANAGDPMGFWRAAYNDRRAKELANQQTQYDQKAQKDADSILPQLMMGLGPGAPMNGDAGGPQAPMPGQNSAPPPPPPQGGPPPSGGAGPNIAPLPGGPMGPPPGPAPQTVGPQLDRMAASPAQGSQPAGPGPAVNQGAPQGPGGMTRPGQGYELQDVMRVIKTQYPNVSGAALRNILTTINPLILTPQARLQVEWLKYQMQAQKLPIMQENADSRAAGADSTAMNRFGMNTPGYNQVMSRMPQRPQGRAPMGPGASQIPTNNIPPVNASSLTPPPGMGGAPSYPTAGTKNANSQATEQGKANTQWENVTLPQIEQGLKSVDQARKAFADTDAFTSGGLAPTKRAYLAGVIADLTGSGPDVRSALVAQLQQKSAAELLISQIAAQPGASSRQTDRLRGMIQDAKMDPSKIPAANAALADSIEAGLEQKRLEGNFKADWSNGPGGGLFDRNGRHAMEDAFEAHPLVTFGKGGVPEFNRANVKKVRKDLDEAYNGQKSAGPDTSDGIQLDGPNPNNDAPEPSQEAIRALVKGEGTAEQFDAIFGQGAAKKVLGNGK